MTVTSTILGDGMWPMLKVKARGGKLRVDGTFMKVRVRESTGLPVGYEAEAEAERLKIEQKILAGTYKSPTNKSPLVPQTVADGCKRYRKWVRMEGRETADSGRKVNIVEATFGDLPVVDIPKEEVIERTDARWPTAKPGTIRRYLGVLNAVLGHVEETYDIRCKRVRRPAANDERDIHWTEEETVAFLSWCHDFEPHFYPHFLTLCHTGARLNEALRIARTWIVRNDLLIQRRLARSGKTVTRTVPLSHDMKHMLLTAPLPTSGTLLRTVHGTMWNTNNAASAQLGLVLRRGILATGVTMCTCHDLRHTFAWMSAQNGADLADLQSLMGHEDISQTTRYRGFVKSRAVSAIKGFPKTLDASAP